MYQVPSAGKINPASQSKFKVNKQLRPVERKEKLKADQKEVIKETSNLAQCKGGKNCLGREEKFVTGLGFSLRSE